MQRYTFLRYPVDSVSIPEALEWIDEATRSRTGKAIAVTNANKLWLADRNKNLARFMREADLVVPEYAVVWGAGRLGKRLTHVGGIMLLKAFLPYAAEKQIRTYFLGARDGVVKDMVRSIAARYPIMPIVGFHHGYLGDPGVKDHAFEDIRRTEPEVLFVGMGSPKQEMLISELKRKTPVPVMMGVGGSFDVLSGQKQDAPAWARSKGLEWLYRISQDPLNMDYWRRYLTTNCWFVSQVVKARFFGTGN